MELEQLEALALGDREHAIAQLIPGTEDYYFHRCLEHLHRGELDATEPLFVAWVERHGETARVRELRDRRALLSWDRDPTATCEHVRRRLGVSFTHQREVEHPQSDLPSVLDPDWLSRARFMADAMRHNHNVDGFTERAFEWLIGEELDLNRVRALLQRLTRPDYPGIVERILAELGDRHSSGFGSFGVHTLLTLEQLDQLASQRPALLDSPQFVETVLARLLPGPDVDLDDDLDARAAHLATLWAFVEPQAPAYNSLKVHVLYHQLELGQRRGNYDRASFERYLELPRESPMLATKYRQQHRHEIAELHRDYRACTGLEPVGDDVALVTDYLTRLFADPDADDHRVYARWLSEDFLRRVFAEAKILAGIGDPERWYSLLDDPGYYQQLKDRVTIALAPTNPRCWAADAPVELIVDVENVETLVVKVFEVNVLAYFLAHGREVDSGVDLDGLVANDERVLELKTPALRRVRHALGFEGLARPGTFVIELIGGGKSSRAVIRKGALRYLERRTSAGHALTIVDAVGQPVVGASAWFGGREFVPDARGEIRIPYLASNQAKVLLRHGSLSSVVTVALASEDYQLDAGIHVEREQLIAKATATVVISATLSVAGTPIDVSLLKEPKLRIESTDGHSISSSVTIPLKLRADGEASHTFKVPESLRTLRFTLFGKLWSVTSQRDVELSVERQQDINELDLTAEVADLHLARTPTGYVVHVLGKSGEPRAGVEVGLAFAHRDFAAHMNLRLQTDAHGRIELGELGEITRIQATLGTGRRREWPIHAIDARLPAELHTASDRPLTLARPSGATIAEAVSLLERRGDGYVRDCGHALALTPDSLVIAELAPGDYDLAYKLDGVSTQIRVGPAVGSRGWLISQRRQLELSPAEPLRIRTVDADDRAVTIMLGGATATTRVHVFGRRFVPDQDAARALEHSRSASPRRLPVGRVRSLYLSGRDIGDEYRYILDRKRADVFAGNLAERPGLLLNPWALRTTSTGVASAATGSAYATVREEADGLYTALSDSSYLGEASTRSSNLDFLADPALVLLDLRPDADGQIVVTREQLGSATDLRIVAIDRRSQAAAELILAEAPIRVRDRRLLDGLDPSRHFVLRKRRACLGPAAELVIDDVRTAKLEAVDTIGKAHGLLSTLSNDAQLREFEFLTRWPTLTAEDQRERYAKYACHELHLFLARKDPEFFAAVVRPYLANKRDPTFMDHYLLEADLTGYLEPWAHARLNALEQVLLAERIVGERGPSSRHLRDCSDLLPPNVEADNAAFDTALQGSALAQQSTVMFEVPAAEVTRGIGYGGAPGGGPRGGPQGFGPPPAPAAPPSARMAMAAPAPSPQPANKPKRAAKRSRAADVDESFDDAGEHDLAARDEVRRFFQALDKTEEWAENNYYRRRIAEQGAGLIPIHEFWREFAEYVASGSVGPFLSGRFVRATSCLAEMLCALAVLDLPFESEPPIQDQAGVGGRLRASTPLIVFHEQVSEVVAELVESLGVLVSQHYFRADDRYRYENDERHDKYVSGELLVHTAYVCQVVLTNPSSSAHKLDLVVQIPRGAIPVQGGFETRDLHVHLPPRGTHAIEYWFYFPAPGRFEHFPVHVAKHEALVAFAEPVSLEVVTELRRIDTESWSHVSQRGTDAELLAYLDANNLGRLGLERIAWRMRKRQLFDAVLAVLRARHVYVDVLWSYALHHRAAEPLAEYLRAQDGFMRGCGLALDSTLLQIRPIERRWVQHLEYAPLVNARVHPLGPRRKILNSAFQAQYREFLTALTYVRAADDDALVVAAYYALLQDRVREALKLLDRVTPAQVTGALQWDYLQAYLALTEGDVDRARELASRHAEHPVPRWRKRFANLLAILAEVDGARASVSDPEDRQQQQAKLAATEASVDFEIVGDTIIVSHVNLAAAQLNFYKMDIELLFSRQPFMQDQSDRFAIVQPNLAQALALVGAGPTRVDLPVELRSANTIVELLAGGVRRSKANYAHDLAVRVIEPYGQVRVHQRSSGNPLARAYVKVYARKRGGGVDFYKDGYTDLRGAFDYASLSTNELESVERFAIFVHAAEHGALIREAAPPQR